MYNNEHILLCVMGRTASGKDSLVAKLCERTDLKAIISYTTRPRRTNEGDTHIFTTKEQYEVAKKIIISPLIQKLLATYIGQP